MGTKNILGVKPWIINKKNCNMLPIIKSPTDESAVDGFCQSTDIVNVGGSYLIPHLHFKNANCYKFALIYCF